MAKKIHWQIPFASINGNQYTVNIYDEYDGEPVQLTGSAQPFMTEEDDNEDAFLPIRTSTGYMSFIVDNIEDARAIIPQNMTDRFVSLTGNNRVYWEGFIKPEAFTCDWNVGPIEISLPVVSILEAAKSVTFTPRYERRSFDSLLRYCLHQTLGDYYLRAHLTRITPDNSLTSYHVNDAVFAPKEEYEWVTYNGFQGNLPDLKDQASCFDVVEEICKYLGWSLREINGVLNFVEISLNMDIVARDLPEISGADNTFDVIPGKKMIAVTESVTGPQSMIDTNMEHYSAFNAQHFNVGAVSWLVYPNVEQLLTARQFDSNGNLQPANTDVLRFHLHHYTPRYYGANLVRIYTPRGDMVIAGKKEDKSSEFKSAIAMVHSEKNISEWTEAFAVRSRIPYDSRDFPLGIKITGELLSEEFLGAGESWNKHYNDQFRVKIKWGNKYVNAIGPATHATWTEEESFCTISAGSSSSIEGQGKLHANHNSQDSWIVDDSTAVYIAPPDEPINGYIEISFPIFRETKGLTASLIYNLDIQPIAFTDISIDTFTDISENRWRIMNNNFEEGYDMSCKLFSRLSSQQVGTGVVTDEYNSYPTGRKYGRYGGLVSRLARWYNRSIEQITVKTRPAGNASFQVYRVGGHKYLNTSISTNWRDEEDTLKLQKIE